MPRTVIVANWKMHKTVAQTRTFFDALLASVSEIPRHVDLVIAPPFTAISAAREILGRETRVALGAQNAHWETHGAFTGEIAIPMLAEFGVRYLIVGHSERRIYFNETDATVNLKVKAALAHGVVPIVAVGESADERAAGATDARVVAQTRAGLAGLDTDATRRVVLAYEPIWAIGTGANCDPVEANRVMGVIRESIPALEDVSILYGGSVKPDNVAAYAAQPHVNGGLVGGASLDADRFAELIEAASHHA